MKWQFKPESTKLQTCHLTGTFIATSTKKLYKMFALSQT